MSINNDISTRLFEFFGKYWDYSNRQWSNLGVKFTNVRMGIIDEQWFVDEIRNNEGISVPLSYALMQMHVLFVKMLIASGNQPMCLGITPELLYDRMTWKLCNIQKHVRDVNGNFKPSFLNHPITHVRNCMRTWMKQLAYEMDTKNDHHTHRYERKAKQLAEKTVYLEPEEINRWIDQFSEDWINCYVYDPDRQLEDDNDKEIEEN